MDYGRAWTNLQKSVSMSSAPSRWAVILLPWWCPSSLLFQCPKIQFTQYSDPKVINVRYASIKYVMIISTQLLFLSLNSILLVYYPHQETKSIFEVWGHMISNQRPFFHVKSLPSQCWWTGLSPEGGGLAWKVVAVALFWSVNSFCVDLDVYSESLACGWKQHRPSRCQNVFPD